MDAKIIKFPMKGTRLQKWANVARNIKLQTNMASAKLWVSKNVPTQFRAIILNAI